MLRNMRFYDEKAESAMKWVQDRMTANDVKAPDVLALLKEMSEYRMQAQKCAVDAAPFVHPRLANTTYKLDDGTLRAKAEGDMTTEEVTEYYSKLRLRPTDVRPLVIDNDTGERVDDSCAEAAE